MSIRTKKNRAVYPGTFDPITNGHLSLIERACHLFDEVIVAVAKDGDKNPLFSFEERIGLIERSISRKSFNCQVTVVGFDGLLADFAIRNKARAIVRGLRAVSDFEVEFQMALMNRRLTGGYGSDIETVFLMPALAWVYLSSTIVRDVALHGGDVSGLVPGPVKTAFKRKLKATRK